MSDELESAASAIDSRLQAESNTTIAYKDPKKVTEVPPWVAWCLIFVSCLLFLNAFGGEALFSDSGRQASAQIKANMMTALKYTQDPIERYKEANGVYPEELPNPAARNVIDYERFGDGYILTMEQGIYSVQLKGNLDG